MRDVASLIGTHDVVLVTLDALRYDVAAASLASGRTPNLAACVGSWDRRRTPGSFTYAAHQAFFAGFLPVPEEPGLHPRPFVARFAGSETTAPGSAVFDAPDWISGLRGRGYHAICIGGTGFFNLQTPLGSVLPALFDEAHWSVEMGVTGRDSARAQFALAARRLDELDRARRSVLFINVSAIHQPNHFFLGGERDTDDLESHAAALAHVDAAWPILEAALRRRGDVFLIVCSDHGTAYGEDGYVGHRTPHPVVWTVPYAEVLLTRGEAVRDA